MSDQTKDKANLIEYREKRRDDHDLLYALHDISIKTEKACKSLASGPTTGLHSTMK